MYKISCFNRAETDVYKQFLHKFSIGIKISNVPINSAIIGPNGGCCLVKSTFLLQHIIPKIGDNLKNPPKNLFMFSFDDTEEKVAVRFESEKGQDTIYEITLGQYSDPENRLPIDPSIRFSCVAHPV